MGIAGFAGMGLVAASKKISDGVIGGVSNKDSNDNIDSNWQDGSCFITRIKFLFSFDPETLTGGRVYQNIINDIVDRHVSGEIKNLEYHINDLVRKSDYPESNAKLIKNQVLKDIYSNILNDPEKNQKFINNIFENITNNNEKRKYSLINSYLEDYSNIDISNKYFDSILNKLIELNDNKEFDKLNKFFNEINGNKKVVQNIRLEELFLQNLSDRKNMDGLFNFINNHNYRNIHKVLIPAFNELIENKDKIEDYQLFKDISLHQFIDDVKENKNKYKFKDFSVIKALNDDKEFEKISKEIIDSYINIDEMKESNKIDLEFNR